MTKSQLKDDGGTQKRSELISPQNLAPLTKLQNLALHRKMKSSHCTHSKPHRTMAAHEDELLS